MITTSLLPRVVRPTGPSARDRAVGGAALTTSLALWGMVFLAPTIASDVPPALLAGLRYLGHGATSLVILRRVGAPTDPAVWRRAAMHAATGFVGYYMLLSVAVRTAGTTLVVLVMAASPVVYTLAGRPGVPLRRLAAPMALLVGGGALAAVDGPIGQVGALRALVAVVLVAGAVTAWTWFGHDNARVVADPSVDLARWAATTGVAAGLLSLPLVAFGLTEVSPGGTILDGRAVAVVVVLALACTTLANRTWNIASRRLRPTTIGPLLALETVFALGYAHLWDGTVPGGTTLLGEVLLVTGAIGALLVLRGGSAAQRGGGDPSAGL